jgi:NadR type nicotinamide-nucleotide adenylyltransferase
VLVLNDPAMPPNDADDMTQRRFVARVCRETLHTTVDAVFTSEAYGDGFARELTERFRELSPAHPVIQHVSVDPQRVAHAVSGTAIRLDVHTYRQELSPLVYADFVERICVLGGESSGKSTLAAALAKHFNTLHVAEFGRELWEEKDGRLVAEDMLRIAQVQVEREDEAAGHSNRFLFCDTSPLTTLFYSQFLFDKAEPELKQLASRAYRLNILCAPDFPFVQDGTRRDDSFRGKQHDWYCAELTRLGMTWIEVRGPVQDRVDQVNLALSASASPLSSEYPT